MTAMGYIVMAVIVLLAALVLAGGLTWVERRLLALWQDRLGPNRAGPFGLLQMPADLLKLLFKEDFIPPLADKAVFVLAPAIVVVATLVVLAVIPFAPGLVLADLNVGLLFFLAMSSLAVYGVALGGWSSNNKFALLGGLRAVGQIVSYEVFMGLSLMGVVALAGSFNLSEIVKAQQRLWFCIPQFPGLVIYFISGVAEAHRLPFDLPEAESELVAGYHTEYSGFKFAMFFIGEYLGITVTSALIVTLFFGGWLGPALFDPARGAASAAASALLPAVWFILKTLFFIGLFILMRAALPRPRYDQLMAFGWKVMLPLALLNLLATGGIVLALGSMGGK